MKNYSQYTEKYVQDICEAMASENLLKKTDGDPLNPRDYDNVEQYNANDFEHLGEFLKHFVVMPLKSYNYLNGLGLVNTGFCPYTGEKINETSSQWTYMGNRSVQISNQGLKLMQKEDEDRHNFLNIPLKTHRPSILRKLIVFGIKICILYLFACIFSLAFNYFQWNWFSKIFFIILVGWTFSYVFIKNNV